MTSFSWCRRCIINVNSAIERITMMSGYCIFDERCNKCGNRADLALVRMEVIL